MSYRSGGTIGGPLHLNGAVSPGVSVANEGRIYFDQASGKFKVSENGAPYVDLVGGGSGSLQDAYDAGSTIILAPATPLELTKATADASAAMSLAVTDGTGVGLSISLSGAATGPSAVFTGGNVGVGISNPSSRLHAFGSFGLKVRSVSANAVAGDEVVISVDASAGDVTVTLPSAVIYPDRNYYIKKIDSTFNFVFVQAAGVQTIDGQNTQRLSVQYETMQIVSDGSGWLKI